MATHARELWPKHTHTRKNIALRPGKINVMRRKNVDYLVNRLIFKALLLIVDHGHY